MKKLIIFVLPFVLMVACNAQTQTANTTDKQTQTVDKPLPEEIAWSDSTVIVDVRTPGEFAEGHIEKSINIPVDEIANRIEQLKDYQVIIIVCRSGSRSARAKSILENAGFTNIINGGGWQSFDAKMKKSKQ
jgi:rhodanese-related sulfurtransferase